MLSSESKTAQFLNLRFLIGVQRNKGPSLILPFDRSHICAINETPRLAIARKFVYPYETFDEAFSFRQIRYQAS